MDARLSEIIKQVGNEKGVDRKTLIGTLETALATAAKRVLGSQREIEAYYNEQLDEVELFQILLVSDEVENPYHEITLEEANESGFDVQPGDELLVQIFYRPEDAFKAKEQDKRYGKLLKLESSRYSFGRIAAQTAKQVIMQRMREAEQEQIYNMFKDRKGDLITGVIRRYEKGNLIVDIEVCDAILPQKEQTPRENYRPGDRILAYIKNVQHGGKEPQILLSRSDPSLVTKLFEQEVPEIYEGIVRVVRVAREAGVRSKVAVYSRDMDIDPVGACVGMRGARVQAVVHELKGEKIDIVPYHNEPAKFVCSAISPAEVLKVLIDEATLSMELIVPDEQLSLAIGRSGQNVRLASLLTGWSLDIISESRLKALMEDARTALLEYEDVSEDSIDTLFTLGYNKLEHIAQASADSLAMIPGFGRDNAERIVAVAREILSVRQQTQAEREAVDSRLSRELSAQLTNITERTAMTLCQAGYRTVEILALSGDADALDHRTGVGVRKAASLIKTASSLLLAREDYTDALFNERREMFKNAMSDSDAPVDEIYASLFGQAPEISAVYEQLAEEPREESSEYDENEDDFDDDFDIDDESEQR